MTTLKITEPQKIASNNQWDFAVARLGDRWIGYAMGDLEDGNKFMNLCPEVSDDYQIGCVEKSQAIRMLSVYLQDPENGFGDVEEWLIPAEERGNPEEYRCHECGRVLCQGECEDFRDDDWDDWDDECK